MSLTARMIDLADKLSESLKDSEKFENGNDAAGKRVRKVCAEVANECKELRAEIQQIRNHRKS